MAASTPLGHAQGGSVVKNARAADGSFQLVRDGQPMSDEPSSWEKARHYFATPSLVRDQGRGLCLGSYAFLWSNKQETTSTWYGMFLESGSTTTS